jgi:hypothetical protein
MNSKDRLHGTSAGLERIPLITTGSFKPPSSYNSFDLTRARPSFPAC